MNRIIVLVCFMLFIMACQTSEDGPLPRYGIHDIQGKDTTFHHIPDFRFMNQDSVWITNDTYKGKAYVSEFFFTYCPSICPNVKVQLNRLYEHFEDEERLWLLGHAIDSDRDTIPRLKSYADKLGIEGPRWSLVHGEEDIMFTIDSAYMSIAYRDPDAPGGFDHTGRLILVDQNRHIRSFCEGTKPDQVDRFIKDIEKLLREEY